MNDAHLQTGISDAATPRGADLRHHLLDVAEALFADRGYFGVSIREITEGAGTRLAAVNYHFGSKDDLFREVIGRRAAWLNHERLRLLKDHADVSRPEAGIRRIVRAFYLPLLDRFASGDPGWRNYCRLISQVAMVHVWMESHVAPMFNATSHDFVRALCRLAPHAGERRAIDAYQFVVATALYLFADNRRINTLTQDRFRSQDMTASSADMEEFCVGGVVRLLGIVT